MNTGHWSMIDRQSAEINPIEARQSPNPRNFYSERPQPTEKFLSFLFHKHTTPATRRVGARVLLSDFSNVCNIPYNHTEMKPIELSSLLQTKFSSGQPRQTEKPFELSLSHVLLRWTLWYAGLRPVTCGVYVRGGVYPRPTYFSRGFPSDCNITRHDATRLRVLLLGFTNVSIYQEYTIILELCFGRTH